MTADQTALPTKPPRRLTVWVIAAVVLAVLAVLANPNNMGQVLGKLFAVPAGAALGSLLFDTLLPYARPSSFLAEPWYLTMTFKSGEPDFKIVPGKEQLFVVCCCVKAFCMMAGAYVLGLGN